MQDPIPASPTRSSPNSETGTVPWIRPWSAGDDPPPRNAPRNAPIAASTPCCRHGSALQGYHQSVADLSGRFASSAALSGRASTPASSGSEMKLLEKGAGRLPRRPG